MQEGQISLTNIRMSAGWNMLKPTDNEYDGNQTALWELNRRPARKAPPDGGRSLIYLYELAGFYKIFRMYDMNEKQTWMPRKVVILGAGAVGSTFAYALAQSGIANEITILDLNQDLAKGQVLDLAHGLSFYPNVQIKTGSRQITRMRT
jgi:threonine dehydrogenase-like Zn-dependent dehydrogenase